MRILLFVSCCLLYLTASSQSLYTKYWIQFTDKNGSQYSLDKPEEFLSPKALARRQSFDISIQTNDLPVNQTYVKEVRKLAGNVLYASRWFNGVMIEVDDSEIIPTLEALSFVKKTQPTSRSRTLSYTKRNVFRVKKQQGEDVAGVYYGKGVQQMQMLKGDFLHASGYRGKGMTVAIMDAGFKNADQLEIFKSLYANGQVLGTMDFVDRKNNNVYGHSLHGTQVWSIMAGNLPETFVGAAPEAAYWLFRTEDGRSENIIEEYNWIAAAEFADSVGVDVINTSLGYSTFDDPNMNYTPEDLDGNTARITIAADIAASKGMLVVCSAGNLGNKKWRQLTMPADADSILTVGAVDSWGLYAYFSSKGMVEKGKVKPNVVALGRKNIHVDANGKLIAGNGTSFSAPLIAGLTTCLWQANRHKSNMEIIKIIENSSNRVNMPDEYVGNGLPNFHTALVKTVENGTLNQKPISFLYPNSPVVDAIYYHSEANEMVTLELLDHTGRLIEQKTERVENSKPYTFKFDTWQQCPQGIYCIRIKNKHQQKTLKALKTS